MKNVGINATILSPKAGGVGEYMVQIIKEMQKYPADQRPSVFINKQAINEYNFSATDCITIPTKRTTPLWRIPHEFMQWKHVLSKYSIDLFHSPISYIPPGVNIPSIVTIHDLRYFHYPQTYQWLRGKFLGEIIPFSLKKATKVIAVSEYTRSDIIKLFDIDENKIVVIHEGIDTSRFEIDRSHKDFIKNKIKYKLPDRYILAVGHLEPRKNFHTLFKAFRLLHNRYKVSLKLVIVGQENWFYEKIYQSVKFLKLDECVHFTGFVDESDLTCIYKMADFFVAPSLFEGFGFTPLEAMASGIPVLASDCTSHPEICGDAALYFDPHDEKDMANKMHKILTNYDLRESLIKAGKKNIQRFSWKKCYEQTRNLYRDTLDKI